MEYSVMLKTRPLSAPMSLERRRSSQGRLSNIRVMTYLRSVCESGLARSHGVVLPVLSRHARTFLLSFVPGLERRPMITGWCCYWTLSAWCCIWGCLPPEGMDGCASDNGGIWTSSRAMDMLLFKTGRETQLIAYDAHSRPSPSLLQQCRKCCMRSCPWQYFIHHWRAASSMLPATPN